MPIIHMTFLCESRRNHSNTVLMTRTNENEVDAIFGKVATVQKRNKAKLFVRGKGAASSSRAIEGKPTKSFCSLSGGSVGMAGHRWGSY